MTVFSGAVTFDGVLIDDTIIDVSWPSLCEESFTSIKPEPRVATITVELIQSEVDAFDVAISRINLYRDTRRALANDLFDWTPIPVGWIVDDYSGMRIPVWSVDSIRETRDETDITLTVGMPCLSYHQT
jgi:hypothetical protein